MQDEIPSQTNATEPVRNAIVWEIDEYPRQSRSRNWYLICGLLGAGLIIYAIATANFLFAVIVLMVGIITLISDFKKPDRVSVAVAPTGLAVGDRFYDFRAIRDFSLAYEPPEVKILYVTFREFWQPMLAIPLEDTDPNDVRARLLPFCLENLDRTSETLTETVRRVYKL
jgi:hypothetical protein